GSKPSEIALDAFAGNTSETPRKGFEDNEQESVIGGDVLHVKRAKTLVTPDRKLAVDVTSYQEQLNLPSESPDRPSRSGTKLGERKAFFSAPGCAPKPGWDGYVRGLKPIK